MEIHADHDDNKKLTIIIIVKALTPFTWDQHENNVEFNFKKRARNKKCINKLFQGSYQILELENQPIRLSSNHPSQLNTSIADKQVSTTRFTGLGMQNTKCNTTSKFSAHSIKNILGEKCMCDVCFMSSVSNNPYVGHNIMA